MDYLAARFIDDDKVFFVKAALAVAGKDILFCSCGGNEGMHNSNIFLCSHIKLTRQYQKKEGRLILLSRTVNELDECDDPRREAWLIERNVKQFIM